MKKGIAILCSLSLIAVFVSVNNQTLLVSSDTSAPTTHEHMVGA